MYQNRLISLPHAFGIKSAHWCSYLPGRIWISTEDPKTLTKALRQCNIYTNARRVSISLHELVDRQWRLESSPQAGDWVRGTRGLHKGDLGLVLKHSSSTDI